MHNSLQQEQINLILRAVAGHITPAEARIFFCRESPFRTAQPKRECFLCATIPKLQTKTSLFLSPGIPADLQRHKTPQIQLSSPHPAIRDRKMNHCKGKKIKEMC